MAISELKYGADRSTGYIKIYNLFVPLFKWDVDWGPEFSAVNTVIEQALNLEDVTTEGVHSTNYESLNTYYKLAFLIFGYQAESAFYLFWFFLSISTLIFLVTFFRNPVLLFFLFLFGCALFAISQTQALLLESIIRNRYFSLLTILPSLHLALLLSTKHPRNWITIIGTSGQALILATMAYIRPSSLYQFLFLLGVAIISFALSQKKSGILNFNLGLNRYLWSLALVLISYTLVRLFTLNPILTNTLTSRSCTWHMYYMGLAAHPEASKRYGITRYDTVVYDLVARRATERGYVYSLNGSNSAIAKLPTVMTTLMTGLPSNSEKEIDTCGEIYETIVKDEFFYIFKNDPWFVISSYFYKIAQYFQVYFSHLDRIVLNKVYANPSNPGIVLNYDAFGVIDQLIDWPIIVGLAIGIFLVQNNSLREWLLPLFLFIMEFLSAFLIPFLYFPINHTIADSALSLTIILLTLVSCSICYGVLFIRRNWPKLRMFEWVVISFIIFLLLIILRGLGYQPFKPNFDKASLQEVRFYGQLVDQVFPQYQNLHIISYKDKYYALAQLGQIDVTNRNLLNDCRARHQCFVGNSLEELKLQVSPPKIIPEDYQTFDIVNFDYKFYVLSHKVGFLYEDLDPMVLISEQFLQNCQTHGQCAIGNSLEEAKQLVDLMPKLVMKNYQGFDIVSYYYKYYIFSQGLNVLDRDLDPAEFAAESFLQECQTHGQCAVGNSLEEAKQLVDLMPKLVMKNYQGFDIVSYYYKYYIFSQELNVLDHGLDPARFTHDRFLEECQAHGQCAIANSPEEAEQLMGQLIRQTP